jgi:hypothetical protein
MMTRWIPLALLLVTTPATAGKTTLWAGGGVSIVEAPTSFTNRWQDSIGFAGGIGYRTGPWLEVGAAISIDRFPPDGNKVAEWVLPGEDLTDAVVGGGDASIMLFSGEARIFFPFSLSRFSLWVSGAGGFWRRSFEPVTIDFTASGGDSLSLNLPTDEEFAAAAGAGAGFRIGQELWLTLEARYLTTFADVHTRTVPIRLGVAYR